MAGTLKTGWWLLLVSAQALAQNAPSTAVGDPTQPPASFVAAPAAEGNGGTSGSRLRSIILPRNGGRPAAVIDGQVIRLGEKLGEARLIRLTETRAVLEGPAGKETLYLTPDVTKTPVVTKTARQRKKELP